MHYREELFRTIIKSQPIIFALFSMNYEAKR